MWAGTMEAVKKKRSGGASQATKEYYIPVPELSTKTAKDFMELYTMDDIQESAGWDKDALLFIAALSGSDFSDGVFRIGPTVAGNLAKGGYASTFATAARVNDLNALKQLKKDLTDECKNNTSGLLRRRQTKANFDALSFQSVDNFLNPKVLDPMQTKHLIHFFANWEEMKVDVDGLWEFARTKMGWRSDKARAKFQRILLVGLRMQELRKVAHRAVRKGLAGGEGDVDVDREVEVEEIPALGGSSLGSVTLNGFFPVRKSHLLDRAGKVARVGKPLSEECSTAVVQRVREEEHVEKVRGRRVHLDVAEVRVVWGPTMLAMQSAFAKLPVDNTADEDPEDRLDTPMEEEECRFSSPPPTSSQPFPDSQMEEDKEWDFGTLPLSSQTLPSSPVEEEWHFGGLPASSSQPFSASDLEDWPHSFSPPEPSSQQPVSSQSQSFQSKSTTSKAEWVEVSLIKAVAPDKLEVFDATEAWKADMEAEKKARRADREARRVEKAKGKRKRGPEVGQLSIRQFFGEGLGSQGWG
ncbi:hypothetical protein HK097_009003 [Rhizophlyctis rosea]|uniref:Uncharacterized protein n=1 Tax=Rhizophlyctis rosea TaxID=64517 RepID=A0AAD5X1C5_9FUNG|nr:hypothetical protein HK097_009003 [Rhizophlyctis rosea]